MVAFNFDSHKRARERYSVDMRSTVILKHEVPDGTTHFDWLIDQPELEQDHRLLSWRCNDRPDLVYGDGFECVQLPDHRSVYLTYEGEISGNRGVVSRLANGVVTSFVLGDDTIEIAIDWDDRTIVYKGCLKQSSGSCWCFSAQIL